MMRHWGTAQTDYLRCHQLSTQKERVSIFHYQQKFQNIHGFTFVSDVILNMEYLSIALTKLAQNYTLS